MGLNEGSIRTVMWATAFRAVHSWLDVPVLDREERIQYDGDAVPAAITMLPARPGERIIAINHHAYNSDTLLSRALMRMGILLDRLGLLPAATGAGPAQF